MYKKILFILLFAQICMASLINRIQNGCEQPPVPSYLPDSGQGSYCRYAPRYGTMDLVFLLDCSSNNDITLLNKLQPILHNSLKLPGGLFSNTSTTNNVAFVCATNISQTVVNFGGFYSDEEVAAQFDNLIQWRNQFNNSILDLSKGLKYVHEQVFDYSNGRGKLLTIIANSAYQLPTSPSDLQYSKEIQLAGGNIFSIGFNENSSNFGNFSETFLGKAATVGWHHPLLVNSSNNDTSTSISYSFKNFIRQSNCRCPSNTTQFFAILLSKNQYLGTMVKEIYADCLFKGDERNLSLGDAAEDCQSNTQLNARLVALNTSAKYEFVKDFLAGNEDVFWSGKNGTNWITYLGTILPVTWLPLSINDSSIQNFCNSNFGISGGTAAALVPYNGSYVLCEANSEIEILPLCEYRAIDAFDNPLLCPGPFVNADSRPEQSGSPCSMNLFNIYLDLIVIVDVSQASSLTQLKQTSQILLDSFKRLNFDFESLHSTRLGLITYASVPILQTNLGDVKNLDILFSKFNLSKYRTIDPNGNAVSAFNLAKTLLLLNQSKRKPGIIFITNGITTSDPYSISQSLQKLFDVRVITVSLGSQSDKIDRIASNGMNLQLNNHLQQQLPKTISYMNCFCGNGYTQFIAENQNTNETVYFADCLRGFSTPQTPNDAFTACRKLGGVPVALTSQAKSDFLRNSLIYAQINKSPAFVTGLKRRPDDVNVHEWQHYANQSFSIGNFPKRSMDFNFDSLETNCSMAISIEEKTFVAPISCTNSKLPYICEVHAFDGDLFGN